VKILCIGVANAIGRIGFRKKTVREVVRIFIKGLVGRGYPSNISWSNGLVRLCVFGKKRGGGGGCRGGRFDQFPTAAQKSHSDAVLQPRGVIGVQANCMRGRGPSIGNRNGNSLGGR